MNDPILEAELRTELKLLGERWCKSYKIMSDDRRREYLVKLKARRTASQELAASIRLKLEQEPDERPSGPTCGTLQSGTGGGRRLILKGSPFS